MCDECIDAVKENPFTGDGARFVNIESVLKSLDKRVTELEREATSPQPQPRTPRLVEAVGEFLPIQEKLVGADKEDWTAYDKALGDVTLALAAEKKRQVLVDKATTLCYIYRGSLPSHAREAVEALEAFDKERGV